MHWAPGIPVRPLFKGAASFWQILGRIAPRGANACLELACLKIGLDEQLHCARTRDILSSSSPANAGDPVIRGVSDGIEKPQRTGYPACAEYDESL